MNLRSSFYTAIFLLVGASASADYLQLMNDSPYKLTVTVQNAQGEIVGEYVVEPNGYQNWSSWSSNKQYDPNVSQSPYSVRWNCMEGTTYSYCEDVSEGAGVSASMCNGQHMCKPKNPSQSNQ